MNFRWIKLPRWLHMLALLAALAAIGIACGGEATPVAQPEPTQAMMVPTPTPVDLSAITSEMQKSIADAIAGMETPETMSEAELQRLVQEAVIQAAAAAPAPLSEAEIAALVESAVAQAAASAPEAPEPLSEAEIAAIVKAAIPTPVPQAAAVPQATAVPPSVGSAKVNTLIAAIAPQIIEIVLPWRATASDANQQVRHFADPLVHIDSSTGSLVPGLAESWEMTKADGTEWTFKLKKGVQFHDGWGEFTAKDFIHTATRIVVNEDSIATDQGLLRSLYGETEEEIASNITAPDPYTLVMRSKKPDADIPRLASAQVGNLFILSADQYAAEGLEGVEKQPAGTGPFRMSEFSLGSHILYDRVEDHWRVTPAFEQYKQIAVPEVATRMAMALAGEAHIVEIDRDLHSRVVERGLEVVNTVLPALNMFFIMGGNYRPDLEDRYDSTVPVTNIKVREAINRAVDKQAIIDTLFAGNAEPMQVVGWHPSLPGYDPKWATEFDSKYGYDPERAKELLAEAGYSDGDITIELKIYAQGGVPEMIPAMEALHGYLRDIGINVESEEVEGATIREGYRGKATHNWIYPGRGPYIPPQLILRYYHISGELGFLSTCEHKVFDEGYAAFNNSVDPVERDRLLRESGQLKFDNYCEVPIAWLRGSIVIDPKVVKTFIYPGNINATFSHIEEVVPVN